MKGRFCCSHYKASFLIIILNMLIDLDDVVNVIVSLILRLFWGVGGRGYSTIANFKSRF